MRYLRPGWTLLETLVSLAILGVLFALALVAVNRARESANRATCLNHLRQLALAVHSYHNDHNAMPPYASMTPKWDVFGGWWLHLMPYASQGDFEEKIKDSSHQIHPAPGKKLTIPAVQRKGIRDARFELLTCPSDPSADTHSSWVGTSNYLANWYAFGDGVKGCYGDARTFRDFADGLSNTVLFGEGYAHCDGKVRPALTVCCSHNFGITPHYLPSDDPSYLPNDYTMFQIHPPVGGHGACDFWRSQTGHATMPVALADGSARFLETGISDVLWKQLLKPADGEPVGGDW